MNFDTIGFELSDGIVVGVCAALPFLVTPMSVDGRVGWRMIVDAVKKLFGRSE